MRVEAVLGGAAVDPGLPLLALPLHPPGRLPGLHSTVTAVNYHTTVQSQCRIEAPLLPVRWD